MDIGISTPRATGDALPAFDKKGVAPISGAPNSANPVSGTPVFGAPIFGAIDLGTNNCRLMLGVPSSNGFRVIESFSRSVGLGEGLAETGQLAEPAMDRAMDALKSCATRLSR